MKLMASFTKSFEVLNTVVVSVLILVMNQKANRDTASFARCFLVAPIGLYSTFPCWIAFPREIMLPAYRGIVALARAMAADCYSTLRYLIRLTTKLAFKGRAVFIPATSLFAIRAIATKDRTKLPLSTGKALSAGAFHMSIIPIAAAKA